MPSPGDQVAGFLTGLVDPFDDLGNAGLAVEPGGRDLREPDGEHVTGHMPIITADAAERKRTAARSRVPSALYVGVSFLQERYREVFSIMLEIPIDRVNMKLRPNGYGTY